MLFTKKIILFFITIFLTSAFTSYSNNEPKERTILLSGKVIDVNSNELLAGVSITASQAEKTIYSDLKGNFFISLKIKDTNDFKLEFSQIGYTSKTLYLADLTQNSGNIEITLTEE